MLPILQSRKSGKWRLFSSAGWQKLIEKWPAIAQQTAQIGEDVSRKAAEELRLRLTDALRQKGRRSISLQG